MIQLGLCIVFVQTVMLLPCYCVTVENNLHSPKEKPNVNKTDELHESFLECLSIVLERDEYEIFPNGTVYVEAFGRSYNKSFYKLVGHQLMVCSSVFEETHIDNIASSLTMTYVAIAGVSISMICLFLHLAVFAVVPEARNLPGYNLASLCFSLLFANVFIIVGSHKTTFQNTGICVASAALTQFFLLASFLWMFVIGFDIFLSLLHATRNLKVAHKEFRLRKYINYSFFSWGISLIIAGLTLFVDRNNNLPELYLPEFEKMCWFENRKSLTVFFAGPVFAIVGTNLVLFGMSAYILFTNRMKTCPDSEGTALKKNYLAYLRLFVIMGATWIIGIVVPYVTVAWLWYLHVVLTTCQGLFIFLAFTCSDNMVKHTKEKCRQIFCKA